MSSSEFSFEGSNSNGEGCDSNSSQQVRYGRRGFGDVFSDNRIHSFVEDATVGVNDFWSSNGFYPESPSEQSSPLPYNGQYIPELMGMDDMHFDMVSTAYHLVEKPSTCVEDPDKSLESEISELLEQKEVTRQTTFQYFEILNSDQLSHNSNGEQEQPNDPMDEEAYAVEGGDKLSTEEVMRIAAAHYIQLSTDTGGESCIFMHPFRLTYAGLSSEEIKNVELASLLLAAAEKASSRQYDRSRYLLRQCQMLSSSTGNAVQRVVYYFADALQEKIDKESGRLTSKGSKPSTVPAEDVIRRLLSNHPIQLATHRKLPFARLMHFTSVQTIIENVELATRVHVIDLSIKHGLQWSILIQALATRSTTIEYLKISAVGLSEEAISETGKRLMDFAESLNLAFDFKIVIVPDMKHLKDDLFEIEADEAICVYSAFDIGSMLVRPECLENLMRVVRRLRPCIMTVVDVEANHNSPSFINRFTESLFYFSAFFDCFESCMDGNDKDRMFLEAHDFSEGIQSILATEGDERIVRHVGIGVWRSFFARFGLKEVKLSEWSLYQADLLVEQFPQGNSCTLGKNGKSVTIMWKGTPLHFISAWRFC